MKKLLFALCGALLGGLFCVVLAWGLGHFYGPLYGSEDESTRNFKIFLAALLVSLFIGGYVGAKQGEAGSIKD